TLISLKKNLADNGFGVIDFFNIGYLNNNLVNENFEVIESIKFKLKRYIHNSFLIKEIYFNHNDQNYNFKEKVKALSLNDFKSLFEQANLKIVDIFGDYHLNKFDIINSQRLIFIVQ
ncbi:MAG: SAM-dependent methyltransferase, partial [Flavobacteriaceae bacterium]|nr:SAM-dependent methyltransferase [Flavobacteriaceae bacterium]